jgi:UrcA family protein
MKTFAVATAAVLLTACVIGPAQATTNRALRQEVVSYADLNLDSEADTAILLGRIKSAARKVCGLRRKDLIPIELSTRLEICANDAAARAIAHVSSPLLTRRGQIVVRNELN